MVVNALEPHTAALVEPGDEETRMDPLTPLDTLCRIILRAREYEAQTASDYDAGEDADNVDDENEGTLSVLEDEINDSVEEELKAAFEDLGEDQLAEVIAFCWVGQGTYEAADWDEAMIVKVKEPQPQEKWRKTQDYGVVAEEGLEPPTRGL